MEERKRLKVLTVAGGTWPLLFLGWWFGGGQEAIPYKNSGVNT